MTDERTARRLRDLASFAEEAAFITAHGREAYVARTPDGALLRNAGERVLIKVATVVERLDDSVKQAHPEVEWVAITRMRNLVAHHDEKVNDDLMWTALESRVPALARHLGLDERRE